MSAAVPFRSRAALTSDSGLLSAAFASCPESIALVVHGLIDCANPAFARLFGYRNPSELQGKPLADLLPQTHRCAETPAPMEAVSGNCGYPGCQFEGRRKDGSRSLMESACAQFEVDGERFLVLTVRDISQQERRRVVRDSEKRYRAIFDAAAFGIVQCTTEGRIVECNPAFEAMTGYTREELRGRSFHDFTHGDDLQVDIAAFDEMIGGAREHYQVELRAVRKDKSSVWMRTAFSLVRGPAGEPEFALGMVEDISEQKSTEAQLREAQKMEAVGRLVGGVAHDFNNLLTAVTLYADLLAAGLDSSHRLQRHVDEIRLASERGATLIQHLLAMVRQQPVEPRVVDINDLIDDMRNMLARLIGENIELQTELADDLASVRIDPAEMQQIILNLVLNSRDALPEGGKIKIETRNCSRLTQAGFEPQSGPIRSYISVAVSDDGCGMDTETRARLFEPFFTTKTHGQGNGLGLATVQAITKQAGGAIQLESEPGKGTTVTVLLPSIRQDAEASAQKRTLSSAACGTETILLVEDDLQVRRSVERVLRLYGYEVLVACNGAEALEISSSYEKQIHLVITDLVMPGISGRELAKQLRWQRPQLPVITTSGFEHTRPPRQSLDESFILFRKPFAGDALARKVREVLDGDANQQSQDKE